MGNFGPVTGVVIRWEIETYDGRTLKKREYFCHRTITETTEKYLVSPRNKNEMQKMVAHFQIKDNKGADYKI